MNLISVGDMARAYQLRHQSQGLKSELTRLSQELTTGQRTDTAAALRGDFSTLAGIEGSLAVLTSYKGAAAEATLMVETMQTALGTIQTMTSQAGPSLIAFSTTTTPEAIAAKTADVHQKFMAAIDLMNANTGGRYVLSGAATDRKPVADGAQILDWLRGHVAGQISASDIAAAVDGWFDAPPGGGGFVDLAYGGSAQPLAGIPIAPGETADLRVSAADPEMRDTLKGLALAALVSEGLLPGDHIERARLTRLAGERIIAADRSIVGVQARLGIQEETIAATQSRNAAETATLHVTRSALAEADPYDTATALEAVRAQIETLYTLTARNARLSLTNYLK